MAGTISVKIVTTDFIEGAQHAEGIVVIIDVFRAFSVACYCLAQSPRQVIAVGEAEQALALKAKRPDTLLIGEREGKKLPGFDVGNSPTELASQALKNRYIAHTTHAGTQGLVNALKADKILTGALVNASATANYIRSLNPTVVTLVRMGWKAEERTDEDDLCAEYLAHCLREEPVDTALLKARLLASPCASRFLDPAQPWNPESDLHFCLDIDRFDFAIEALPNTDGTVALRQVKP